jgi:hypothetical protein
MPYNRLTSYLCGFVCLIRDVTKDIAKGIGWMSLPIYGHITTLNFL